MQTATADTGDGGIVPTEFQARTLAFRQHANILNGGGRGSGKSFALALDVVGHCVDFQSDARPLVVRESHGGLQELSLKILLLCVIAFGPRCSRNLARGEITLPTGGIISFSNICDEESYAKLQGRTFTMIAADEAGNYPPQTFRHLQRLRSNLRVPPGMRAHLHYSCNPHGRSHALIYKSYISKSAPFVPFLDDVGEPWIWTQSNYEQNPHINRAQYKRQLLAACGNDEALAKAWIEGDWSKPGGGMFTDVFDPAIHLQEAPSHGEFRYVVGADWGTASPCAATLLGTLKYDMSYRFRAGDIFAIDETCSCVSDDDLATGDGGSVSMWAERIKEMLARNGVPKCRVVQDDARGVQSETVCGELRKSNVNAWPPNKKDRVASWALIRSRLHSAKVGDKRPALWISKRCRHLIETLVEAPRDPLRHEDVDRRWALDHHIDSLSYAVMNASAGDTRQGRITAGGTIYWD